MASVALWLNIFGFLEYLRTRKSKIARAADYPCDKSGIIVYLISLTLFVAALPFFPIIAMI